MQTNRIAMICTALLALSPISQLAAQQNYHQAHGGISSTKLNYDSLYNAATPLESSEQGRRILNMCIEKYGGREHLEKLRSFRLKYRMSADMAAPETADVVKSYQIPRKYKISRRGPSGIEERMLNGDSAWFVGKDTTIFLDRGRFKAELFSYLTLSMPLAAENERFEGIRYGRRDSDSLAYIYMIKRDTLMIIMGIDPSDGLIKSSEGLIRQGNDNFIFINRFSDYSEYDGFLFPGQVINISLGLEVGRSKLIGVDINPQFEDKEFRPQELIDNKKSY